jgi:polysaccharide biosynthesis transport protein
MELLSNRRMGDHIVPYSENPMFVESARPGSLTEEPVRVPFDVGRLVRRYWWLLLAFMILGAAAGLASVVLSSARYRTRLLLEVGILSGITRSADVTNFEGNEVNIQTQINILRSGTFLKRGAERLQSDSVPLAPTGRDIFSRLRQRIHPATQDPLENAKQGLAVAIGTFDARPVNRTRLIELSCESTSPDVAAQFLNSMATEFVEDNSRTRMQTSQRTSEWLAASIEETKSKMQEAEEHLREFVQSSGNVFAGQDSTLEDVKLTNLKGDLAKIQADRIAKQTRYELTLRNPPETLAEILDDSVLRGYKQQINALSRESAVLQTKYTAKNVKVIQVETQLALLEKTYQNELRSVVSRIKNDYEAALRQEKLLWGAYNSQSQRVGSQAAKAAQYNALRREADTLHQVYQNLLMQRTEAGLSSSVPVNPIRIVEPSYPPDAPYKPRPILNISFGTLLGMVVAVGLVFLRERLDQSIKSPGISRRLFNTPELGVIPNVGSNGNGMIPWHSNTPKGLVLDGNGQDAAAALVTWQSAPSFLAESFRGTLASILRNQANGKIQKTILITSPGPAEGKTTVTHNLGIALAESGRRVLLVDADFRRPHLHRKFGLPNENGLADMLSEDTPLADYPASRFGVSTGFPGLAFLPNGATAGTNVSRTLYSPRLRQIFEALMKQYDMILVDAPPILHVADARIIAPLTEALILVLRCGVTNRASAMEACQRIQEDGLSLLGTVLTDYDLGSARKRQYYYEYGDTSRT